MSGRTINTTNSEQAGSHHPIRDVRNVSTAAALLGLIGFLLLAAVPFLPVKQVEASVQWPQGPAYEDIELPLIAYYPLGMTIELSCESARTLDDGVLLSTIPPESGEGDRRGLKILPSGDDIVVVSRDHVALVADRDILDRCAEMSIVVDDRGVHGEILSADGDILASGSAEGDFKPQIVGLYSGLAAEAREGLRVDVQIDSRFSNDPTLLKTLVLFVGVIAAVGALAAVGRLDLMDGRRHRRILPHDWWHFRPLDALVSAVLVGWYIIGGITSDDGYILTMIRVAEEAGYMANYFRWYGVSEAPFGWFYDVNAMLATVSASSLWVRLPTLIAGLLCWWLLSREVIPRLGTRARASASVYWTAAGVFLAFWLPYNNGLRPEPIVAVGALLTLVSVERAIATSRLLPALVAVVIAAFSLAANPTGLMAVAALLAGARPMWHILRKRAALVGYLPLVMPLLAAGVLVLAVVFRDQTFAGVFEASRIRTEVGPSLQWNDEFVRYSALLSTDADGALARRFPVLIMLLALITAVTLLVARRRGLGIARHPAARIVGVTVGSLLLMAASPTKWTHHFGVFAGLGAAVAAVAAVALTTRAARQPRNRLLYAAAVVFVLAISFAGPNAFRYASSWGVPWWDKPPSLQGHLFATAILLLALLIGAIGAWLHVSGRSETRRLRHVTRFSGAPIAAAAFIVVAFQVLSIGKAAVAQYPAYSVALANARSLTGDSCSLADAVLVEADATAGILAPVTGTPSEAIGTDSDPGFTPNGVVQRLPADKVNNFDGGPISIQPDGPTVHSRNQDAPTLDEPGVNGSSVPLPYGLEPSTVPMLGSATELGRGEIVTEWYALPEFDASTPLLVVSAAGEIAWTDQDGVRRGGQTLKAEFGRENADEYEVLGESEFIDAGYAPEWRNLRIPVTDIPHGANVVRLHVADTDLDPRQWVAFTPPRVPRLQTLNEVVERTPTLIDWTVALQFPCQQPYLHKDGVVQRPEYWILPDREGLGGAYNWPSQFAGGSLGFTLTMSEQLTLATYLNEDWHRDWGELRRLNALNPEAVAAQPDKEVHTRWGWWQPGGQRVTTNQAE